MARQTKQMSVNAILDIDFNVFNALNEKQLRKLTTQLVSAANKRFVALEKRNMEKISPAYRAQKERGKTHFTVKGQNYNQLKSTFMEVKHWLEMQTSTISGTKKYWIDVQKGLKKKHIDLTIPQTIAFFEYFEKLKELSPLAGLPEFKYNAYKVIKDVIVNKNDNDDNLIDIYKKWQKYVDRQNTKYGNPEDFGILW